MCNIPWASIPPGPRSVQDFCQVNLCSEVLQSLAATHDKNGFALAVSALDQILAGAKQAGQIPKEARFV